ncbi:uncharacterized protein BX663DRAFT_543496 [Cokeromyces recurvatus]|uniref:uncharacterized protein n=1 Tax=Cokeromyces recurvatus TaxID=90255 RepID=UPI00221EF420|nr:uncharacterized protein BX663DRAFT_543496 [Cokeromyces recurvatus]KAI7902522.1 hypothetical protein BX663DRAFT_543496 [Cokeromyces recurvatus]
MNTITYSYFSQHSTNTNKLNIQLSPPISPKLISVSPSQHQSNTQNYSSSLFISENQLFNTSIVENGSETSEHSDINESLKICVEGIPEQGAKSRVETQIKLNISLTTKDGTKAPYYWTHIKIPNSLLARSKLKKSQQQKLHYGSAATIVSDESKVLQLEARVVCESDETRKIKMCQGCVRRERKRAERKKDSKHSIYDLNSIRMDEAFERERQRILLFNCDPLLNFSTDSITLPTRITCYCRHHNERIGFRIRFALRSNKGIVVATGESPPIMITDDHKSSKSRTPSISSDTIISTIRKRHRTRSKKVEQNNHNYAQMTHVSRRQKYNSNHGDKSKDNVNPMYSSVTSSCFPSSTASTPSILGHFSTISPLMTPGGEELKGSMSPRTPTNSFNNNNWQNRMFQTIANSDNENRIQVPVSISERSTSTSTSTSTNSLHNENLTLSQNTKIADSFIPSLSCQYPQFEETFMDTYYPSVNIPIDYSLFYSHHPYSTTSYTAYSTPSTISPISLPARLPQDLPILSQLIPSSGPSTGGFKITVLGQNFYQGLTLMFGNRAATILNCSPSSLVCILPPVVEGREGPVAVTFKEHPLRPMDPIPPLFNYYESGHQDMMDLSLQMIGLKTAKDTMTYPYHQYDDKEKEEQHIIHILLQHQLMINNSLLVQRTNKGGQNLAHLAAHLNFPMLTLFLLERNPSLVHSQDQNGLSPLHFALRSRATQVIERLLKAGANLGLVSNLGTPLDFVNTLLNTNEYYEFRRQIQQDHLLVKPRNAISWLPSLFVYAASQYYQYSHVDIIPYVDFHFNNSIMIQDNNPLVYHV